MSGPKKKMPLGRGPGKYDELADYVREKTGAAGVLLLVDESGNRGSGFSIQFSDPEFIFNAPRILRKVADQIEADLDSLTDEMLKAVKKDRRD